MKKLLIAAAAVATIGAAEAANVADYKATVKCVYMKQVNNIKVNGQTIPPVLLKYVGVTSMNGYVVYGDCACGNIDGLGGKYSPAYLVVRSFAQTDNQPKIFPADLLVKIIDTRLGFAGENEQIGAEGYLFAGAGKGSTFNNWDSFLWYHDNNPADPAKDANTYWTGFDSNVLPGWFAFDHFGNSSFQGVAPWMSNGSYSFGFASYATRFLFGKYNDAEPDGFFRDSWMDHAGFGTALVKGATEAGCALGEPASTCLEKLSGYLIGGEFICYPNGQGYAGGPYEWFRCSRWVDSFIDPVAGYWTMKRNHTAYADELKEEDGAFFSMFNGGLLAFNRYLGQKANVVLDRVPGFYDEDDGAGNIETVLYYPQYILDFYKWQEVAKLLPFLKSAVAHSEIKNLGFIENVNARYANYRANTVKFLTMGGDLPGANDYGDLEILKNAATRVVYDVPAPQP